MRPLGGSSASGQPPGSGSWPLQKPWEHDSGLGYIGTSQPPAPQSVSGGQIQPGPCGSSLTMLRTAWSGGSYLPSLGVTGQVCGCSPPLPTPSFPWQPRCPFPGTFSASKSRQPRWRGAPGTRGVGGRERVGLSPRPRVRSGAPLPGLG